MNLGYHPRDYELLEFFGVEPSFLDPVAEVGWHYNCVTYRLPLNDYAVEFGVSPACGAVTLIVSQGERTFFHFSARETIDVRVLADASYEALEITIGDGGRVLLRLRPSVEIRQIWAQRV